LLEHIDLYRITLDSGENSLDRATALHKLGRNVFRQGRHQDGFGIAQEIVRLHEVNDGVEHLNTGNALNNLAAVAFRLGKKAIVDVSMKRTLHIYINTYGDDSKEVLLHRAKMLTFKVRTARYMRMRKCRNRYLLIVSQLT
jgi:Tetratricopeptide repeat